MIMFGNYYFTNNTMHLITLLKNKNISTNITYLLIKTNVKFSSGGPPFVCLYVTIGVITS